MLETFIKTLQNAAIYVVFTVLSQECFVITSYSFFLGINCLFFSHPTLRPSKEKVFTLHFLLVTNFPFFLFDMD